MSLDYSVPPKNVNLNITTMFSCAYNIEQNVEAKEALQKHIRIKDLTEERKIPSCIISSSSIAKSQILIQNGVITDNFVQ
ncbi:MAG: hypothetical protein IKL07_08530 [Clostridium sp.]|nr:hypothetical protein [Clostridium sp.]